MKKKFVQWPLISSKKKRNLSRLLSLEILVNPFLQEKIWKGLNKIEDDNEKIYSPFSETISQKMDFTAFGLYRDHPQAWELINGEGKSRSNRILITLNIYFLPIF